MGQHLGVVLRPAERLDPGRRALVALRSGAPGDLAVGDVADEQVPERVLVLAAHRGAPLAADELLPLERVQPLLRVLRARALADRADGAEPEDLPEHRGVLEELLLARRKPVEAGRDDPLDVLRERWSRLLPDSTSSRANCSA